MLKKLIFAAWIGLIGISVGCDGDKGDVGPAGATGATGPQGAKGDTGIAGRDGIGAREIMTGVVQSTKGGYTLGKTNLSNADTAMIAKSVVIVFIKSKDLWWSLPGPVEFGDQKTTFNFVTLLRARQFFVDIRPVSWSEPQDTPPAREFQSIRAVIVPTSSFRLNADVDWNNYEEVVKTLGIKESDILKADI